MKWDVEFSRSAGKQASRLPAAIKDSLLALILEISYSGPVRGNWSNYSKLQGGRHHCHLKKGKPTYVAVWQVLDKPIRTVEVIYVGTHEKAPY